MGLEDIVSGVDEEESSTRGKGEEYCPSCGGKGEETERWYWRCPNDCDVVTYIPPNRSNQ